MDPESPYDQASWFRRLTFGYINSTISQGRRNLLKPADLPPKPPLRNDVSAVEGRFYSAWQFHDSGDPLSLTPAKSLSRTLRRTFKNQFISAGMPHFIREAISVALTLIINLFIRSFEEDSSLRTQTTLAIILISSILLNGFLNTSFVLNSHRLSLDVRSSLTNSVYNKILQLSNAGLSLLGAGRITNVVSQDVESLYFAVQSIFFLITGPFRLLLSIGLLLFFAGTSLLFGLIIPLFSFPLLMITAKKMMKFRRQALMSADKRVKLTTEIINGIKSVKMGAYEDSMRTRVEEKRDEELKAMKGLAILRGVLFSILFTQPVLMTIIILFVQVNSGQDLVASTTFTTINLLMQLSMPLVSLSTAVARLSEAKVSIKRLEAILTSEEVNEIQAKVQNVDDDDVLVDVDNGTFSYELLRKPSDTLLKTLKDKNNEQDTAFSPDSPFTLSNINFTLKKGEFYLINGKVASGKTSFLSSLLGELRCKQGTLHHNSNLILNYATQNPWLLNTTIKGNIIMHEDDDDVLYSRVIDCCSLLPDLEQLGSGDLTFVGEQGVSLSGGQKARVALARTIYQSIAKSRRGISVATLLDDPIAAVDVKSARHILQNCLLLMKESGISVVLATHHVSLVQQVAGIFNFNVVLLDDGKIVANGSFSEMESHPYFRQLIEQSSEIEAEGQNVVDDDVTVDVTDKPATSAPSKSSEVITGEDEEKQSIGKVKWSVFGKYFNALGGLPRVVIIAVLFIAMQAFSALSDLSLSSFLDGDIQTLAGFMRSVGLYRLLNAFFSIISLVSLSLIMLKASRNLHSYLLRGIFAAPISFFERTPLGRIQNRFSRDLGSADTNLAMAFNFGMTTYLSVIASTVVIVLSIPNFVFVLPIAFFFFFIVQQYYRATSRQLARLQATLKSPVFSTISETLSGMSVIRSGKMNDSFITKFKTNLNKAIASSFHLISANCWLSLRLSFLSSFCLISICAFLIYFELSPATAGLTITHTLNLLFLLQFVVQATTELENSMSSVERVLEYAELPSEEYFPPGSRGKSLDSWPNKGDIVFENVSVQYGNGGPQALKDFNLQVKAGEKVGIIGKSGAGKSTLFASLFLTVRPSPMSKIYVDDVDITTVPLSLLRTQIAAIPQDPMLISGTIRDNVDLKGELSDDVIIELLTRVQLTEFASDSGIHKSVEENGGNLSSGQRQLIVCARALGRNCKVFVLDEASSSVDFTADNHLQQVLRESCGGATVITIAHRLDTIISYDRIVVLKDGEIVEVGNPRRLLEEESVFSEFVAEMGSEQSARLYRLASEFD
ncbi:hypothetical protein P9112_005512 [Eukaryota sp. TZLM1-RC]